MEDPKLEHIQAYFAKQELREGRVLVLPCLPSPLPPRDEALLSAELEQYVPEQFHDSRSYGGFSVRIRGQNIAITPLAYQLSPRELQPHLEPILKVVLQFFSEKGGVVIPSPLYPPLPNIEQPSPGLIHSTMRENKQRLAGLFGTKGIFPSTRRESEKRLEEASREIERNSEQNFLNYTQALAESIQTALLPHWSEILLQIQRQGEVAEAETTPRPCIEFGFEWKKLGRVIFHVGGKRIVFNLNGQMMQIVTEDLNVALTPRGTARLSALDLENYLPDVEFLLEERRCRILARSPKVPLWISLHEAKRAGCAVRNVEEQGGGEEEEEGDV